MTTHRGLDHKGVMRECVQEWHFCGARDGDAPRRAASTSGRKNARLGQKPRGPRPIPIGARIHDLESRLRNISGLIAAMESERVRILTELHFLAKERNA